MKKSFDFTGLVIAISFVVILFGWWGIVALWQPTVSIMAPVVPYSPLLWVVSLSALAVPFGFFLGGNDFRCLDPQRKILIGGLAILTVSMVHSIRCFLDAQIIFFITTVLYFILNRNRSYRKPTWEYWAVFVYVAWNLISLIWSQDLHYGGKLAGRFVPMVLYPVMFFSFRLTDPERDGIMRLFWRVGIMAVLLSLCSGIYELTVQGLSVSSLIHFRIGFIKETFFDSEGTELFIFNMLYAWSGMGHPSYNSLWAVAAVVMGFYLVDKKRIGWVEFAFGELALMQLQLSSQSRIGLLMTLMAWASAYIYLLRDHRKLVYWSVGSFAVFAIVVFAVKPDVLGTFNHDKVRAALWKVAVDYIEKEWLLGTGLGGTNAEYISEVIGYPYPWPEWAHENIYAHNQFIGDWMQSGIFGLLFLIGSIVASFTLSVRRRSYTAFTYCLLLLPFMAIEMPFRFLQAVTVISFSLCLFLAPVSTLPLCEYADTTANTSRHASSTRTSMRT